MAEDAAMAVAVASEAGAAAAHPPAAALPLLAAGPLAVRVAALLVVSLVA